MKGCLQLMLPIFLARLHMVQGLQMYQQPLPQNATLGSVATFACNISDNTGISWLVNDSSHDEPAVVARGVSLQNQYSAASDSTISILTVPCSEENNITVLQCVGYKSGKFAISDEVLLLLQGLLGSVPDLTGTQTAPNQALFKWSAPYSLNGVPVLGYQLFVVISSGINVESASYNESLTDTNYSVTKMPPAGCTHVNVTVHAINSLGPGKEAYYSFRFIENPAAANWTAIDVHQQYVKNELYLTIKLEASNDCLQAVPTSAALIVNEDNTDEVLSEEVCNASESDHIHVKENSTTLTLLITLSCSSSHGHGAVYTGDLILKTIAGTSSLTGIPLDTNVLENVSIAFGPDAPGKVCINCFFVPHVKDRFCSGLLEDEEEHSMQVIISQENGTESGTGCITGLTTGTYSLLVCNADCNINSPSQATFSYRNLSISGIEPSLSDSTSSSLLVVSAMPTSTTTSLTPRIDVDFLTTTLAVAIYCCVGTLLLLLSIFVSLLSIVCHVRRKRKQDKIISNPIMSRNEAYSSVYIHRDASNAVHIIEMNPSPAYDVIGK